MSKKKHITLHDYDTGEAMRFRPEEIDYIEPYKNGCRVCTYDDGDWEVWELYENVETMLYDYYEED